MPYTIPSSVISPGAVYQPRQIPAVISQNARALYYTRGGSTSDSLLLDQSPLNSGTRRTGEEGRCVDLNGTNQAVRVADNAALDITDNLSVMAWVKNDNSTTTGEYVLTKYDTGANKREWALGYNSSQKLFANIGSSDGSAFTSQTSDVAVSIDSWNHVAFTFIAGSVALYVNGSLVTSTASAGHPASLNNENADLIVGAGLSSNALASLWDGQIFDARIYAGDSAVLTAAQIQSIYADGPNSVQFAGQSLRAHYKLDEQSGTTCYDSSGNGNHGTIENAVSNWGVTQGIWSFQNQVGYNTSGAVYIPRDESNPTNDVLGNPLTNAGRRPNDAALHSSNCLTADGTLYIAAAHLTGSETVVSSGGTSTPSISAGRIDFTAGTCWDLTLSDGTHYKLAEGYGTLILDASGSGNHGVLASATLASAWGATQNVYHSNLIDGSGKRMWFDGVDDFVAVSGMVASSSYFGACTISFTAFIENPTATLAVFHALGGAAYRLYAVSGFWRIAGGAITGVAVNGGLNRIATRWNSDGEALELIINGVSAWTGTAAAGLAGSTVFGVGARGDNLYPIKGLIYDFSLTGSAVKNFSFSGYGNTDADWTDKIGSNDGTVVGSPEAFYIPADPNGLDVFGNELTEKPSDATRNRAETLIDLNPDSTPEMGATQLGITVPASHAFGDAFAASDQIFSRQRTLTEDRFVVMPEAQTGSALATIQRYTQP